jgi:hypothetical protein
VVGLILIGVTSRFGSMMSSGIGDILGPVAVIVGLLLVGVVYDLRPWTDT